MSVAREAGDRSKVAVRSHDDNIDPVGTVVGPKGARVQAVVNELSGENMDIVEYSADPIQYIQNALNPAEVLAVYFEAENPRQATVIVANDQLSLAIGKRGQNARLAARLTGFKIDIKPENEEDDFLVGYDERMDEYERKKEAGELEEPVVDEVAADEEVQNEEISEVELALEEDEDSPQEETDEEFIEEEFEELEGTLPEEE